MKLKYLRQAHTDQLKANIFGNRVLYKSESSWLSEHFGGDNWYLESSIVMAEKIKLQLPDSSTKYDLENTKNLYTALKGITVTQATDERLWAYLSHVTYWEYMKKRWDVEEYLKGNENNPKVKDYVRERYFFMANRDRALVRNGISRLWWYGHISYDETREDPFELTAILLEKLDIAQSLLERSFSRNPLLTKTVLSILAEYKKAGDSFSDREKFRDLMKHINWLGGVTILDSLDQSDIAKIVKTNIERIAPAQS